MSASNEREPGREAEATPSPQLGRNAYVALATRLARQGAYAEAEGILRDLPGFEESPAALDLLARIYAQQGRLAEAETQWAAARKLEPGNPAFAQGLEYLDRLRRSVVPASLRLGSAGGLIVAMLGAVLLVGLLLQLRSIRSQLATVAGAVSTIQSEPAEGAVTQATPMGTTVTGGPTGSSGPTQDDVLQALETQQAELVGLRTDTEAIRRSQDALEAQLLEERAAPKVQVDHPMVVVVHQPGAVSLQFKEGLFLYGAVLRPEARAALVELGRQLVPYMDEIQVELVGYQADDETGDYFDLGLLRAAVVFRLLQGETQLPASMLSVGTGAGEPAPYPNDSALNRSKNRTVIWIITAAD